MKRIGNRSGRVAHQRLALPDLMEQLERRVCLSAVLDHGVLTVEGDSGDNQIVVDAGANNGQVLLHGVPGVTDGASFSGVEHLIVRGRAGNDTITVHGALLTAAGTPMRVWLNGGVG